MSTDTYRIVIPSLSASLLLHFFVGLAFLETPERVEVNVTAACVLLASHVVVTDRQVEG